MNILSKLKKLFTCCVSDSEVLDPRQLHAVYNPYLHSPTVAPQPSSPTVVEFFDKRFPSEVAAPGSPASAFGSPSPPSFHIAVAMPPGFVGTPPCVAFMGSAAVATTEEESPPLLLDPRAQAWRNYVVDRGPMDFGCHIPPS